MKRRLESLKGLAIGGTDGEIGKVKEFYFDDQSWIIRYLVVETGGWLSGRKVLLSPRAVTGTDWEQQLLEVNLTMEQIKNSPHIDTDKPVSRQNESDLYGYYPWGGLHWGGGDFSGMGITYPVAMNYTVPQGIDTPGVHNSDEDPHLRSSREVTGYNIKAKDGHIGDLEDLIINDANWHIDFILVDTGNWFPGKKVVLAPQMVEEIIAESSTIAVNATEEVIKNSPEYQPSEELTESYESNLQNYYGRFI